MKPYWERTFSLAAADFFSGMDAPLVAAAYFRNKEALKWYTPHPVYHFNNQCKLIRYEQRYRVSKEYGSSAVWRLYKELTGKET
jgi:hypothetical protein